jgi:sulfatase maturation enzyme AslB (radical SAM superfamily)
MTNKIIGKYNWQDRVPSYIKLEDLTEQQRHRLMDSDTFCMLPWIHLHAWPDGRAYPCCLGKADHPVGNFKQKPMREIWNDDAMREMRRNMLSDQPCRECGDCYEQENFGFSSMRNNSNKNFGQHIAEIDNTLPDGSLPDFKLHYWDVRFSNICQLKCRSCGSIFSSRWYDDDVKLWGRELRPRVQFAGRHEEDVWEQMQEHIPHLDQIYFAGGEPLIMEEHNRILKLLIEKGNTGVRLIYNTNLNDLRYKKESVLDLWRQFPNVCVAASLDDMGLRAEVIRSGTNWAQVEQNIRDLKEQCPHIDFMISPTLSMMNIWNFTRFHRYMVESGFIEAKDFNLNILQGPEAYRIDVLPQDVKLKFKAEFEEHIDWLEPIDTIQRAVGGFRGAVEFMMATDNSHLLPKFWTLVEDLDGVRNESLVAVVPELEQIAQYKKYDKHADEQSTFVESYNDVADPAWPKITSIEEFDTLPEDIRLKVIELQTADSTTIEHNTFIESYNNIADPSWPKISTVEEFYRLSAAIQQEVTETFNITPPQ